MEIRRRVQGLSADEIIRATFARQANQVNGHKESGETAARHNPIRSQIEDMVQNRAHGIVGSFPISAPTYPVHGSFEDSMSLWTNPESPRIAQDAKAQQVRRDRIDALVSYGFTVDSYGVITDETEELETLGIEYAKRQHTPGRLFSPYLFVVYETIGQTLSPQSPVVLKQTRETMIIAKDTDELAKILHTRNTS